VKVSLRAMLASAKTQNRLWAAVVLAVCVFGPHQHAGAAPQGAPSHGFRLIADGSPVAEFQAQSGLPKAKTGFESASLDLDSIRVGLHETPGRNSPQIVSLRGGAPLRAGYLEDWLAAITHGQTRRKTLTIVAHDAQGASLGQWVLTAAQPMAVQLGSGPGQYGEVRIVCQSIVRTK
jgi:hypothetical protein